MLIVDYFNFFEKCDNYNTAFRIVVYFGGEKISPIYRYTFTKEDLLEPEKPSLVTSRGIEPRLQG